MAVIEYMMHRIGGGSVRAVPEFVGDRGHWMSPIDNSFIGWVDDNRDYYVPDTITVLTKQQFVDRQLNIHASHPFMNRVSESSSEMVQMTEAEVITLAETWYDDFVVKNS